MDYLDLAASEYRKIVLLDSLVATLFILIILFSIGNLVILFHKHLVTGKFKFGVLDISEKIYLHAIYDGLEG